MQENDGYSVRRRTREAQNQERTAEGAETRARIAGQASWVFILLNAGGLAATLTWVQALPLEPQHLNCGYVMLRTLPGVAGLLILGVLATVVSYLLRYRASLGRATDSEWMTAIGVSALCLLGAYSWIAYSTVNCHRIAFNLQTAMEGEAAVARLSLAGTGQEQRRVLDDLSRDTNIARDKLSLTILEAQLKDTTSVETDLERTKVLEAEFARRSDQYGPIKGAQYREALARARALEQELEKRLRE